LGAVSAPQVASQREFVQTVQEFAQLMGFTDKDPEIEFKEFDMPEIQAMWNTKTGRYEVNIRHIGTPGLAQYVAVMGRFMVRNFARCTGEHAARSDLGISYWNEFRNSVVGYLIQSVPAFSNVTHIGNRYALFHSLKRMETGGIDAVQRLALELLKHYNCNWTQETILHRILEINQDRGFLPDDVVREAFDRQSNGNAHS
jgi:hypothetical protein